MKKNVGKTDQLIRLSLGLVLFPLMFFKTSRIRWAGFASIPLILTGLTQRCGAYALIGADTCEKK